MTNLQNNKTYEKPVKTKESILFDLNIGAFIKKKRSEYKSKDNPTAKLTQALLGKIINVTFQQIQKYEKGGNAVPMFKLWQLSQFLNFDIGYAITSSANNEHYPLYLLDKKVIKVTYQDVAKEDNIPLSASYWINKMETNKNK